ncbi:MAG: patatin-like phospholipase family protein [Alphaproteobacteria bacterium]
MFENPFFPNTSTDEAYALLRRIQKLQQDEPMKKRRRRGPRKKVSLALQGGGSHGAFAWGVLDRLLEDDRIEIDCITGTSAGAVNAAAISAGLSEGGPQRARQVMAKVWNQVALHGAFSPINPTHVERMMGVKNLDKTWAWQAANYWKRILSPYQTNPLNINPLERIIANEVDFDSVRKRGKKLFLAATDVEAGQTQLFTGDKVSAKAVAASACLPDAFPAVKIGDRKYWDGGYTSNPPMMPLVRRGEAEDIMVVQLTPTVRPGEPTSVDGIEFRTRELTFNSDLMSEMRAVERQSDILSSLPKDMQEKVWKEKGMRAVRLHNIAPPKSMLKLNKSSCFNTTPDFLFGLYKEGREHAEAWLEQNFRHIGKKSSFEVGPVAGLENDLARLDRRRPVVRPQVASVTAEPKARRAKSAPSLEDRLTGVAKPPL